MASLDVDEVVADALVMGYAKAYPGVKDYQDMILDVHARKGHVQNHYGRRYYLQDSRGAYRLGNYCVQGSCADALKRAMINIDYLFRKHTAKSKMSIPVHDEIQFFQAKGEEHLIKAAHKIMEIQFNWCLIPVVADYEKTTTNWAEKG